MRCSGARDGRVKQQLRSERDLRTGPAAGCGVGAVGERERSGARGGTDGAERAEERASQLEAENVLLRMRVDEGASRESACCAMPCRPSLTERRVVVCVALGPREQAERPGRGARGATNGC
jgi:hypothetical protein